MINLKTISQQLISRKVTNAPLVTFRVLFGVVMFLAIVRFWASGWIHSQFIEPDFFFPFIEGIEPLPGSGMYGVFALMAMCSLAIAAGLFYRWSTGFFFLLFTYVELIDKTNYLNHYYFISLMAFLLIWLPAHKRFSMDVLLGITNRSSLIQVGYLNAIKLQLGIVYFFAGIAKINYDWLINAQPLKLWLSSLVHKPVIGSLFRFKITAYIFSWFGMLFDTTIPFFLSIKKTFPYAYLLVVIFHLLTGWLFPIGMFPYIMMVATLVFAPSEWHERIVSAIEKRTSFSSSPITGSTRLSGIQKAFFIVFFAAQVLIPLRYLAYPGNVFWTEAGYRFAWRVMLMEKAGQATFFVEEGTKKHMVANYEFLTPQQEKMMATQPDMIRQYAKFLKEHFTDKAFTNPIIRVESFATLNGRPNQRFIDPEADLTDPQLSLHQMVMRYE